MSNLIPLQTASITQYPASTDKTWYVRDMEGKDLTTISSTYSDKEAMSFLHFARPFELQALNIGINHGRIEAEKSFTNKEIAYKSQIEFLEQQNTMLSEKLEKYIIGE